MNLLRRYLLYLERERVVRSRPVRERMRLMFVGGPRDGEETTGTTKSPRAEILYASPLVAGVIPLAARYKLVYVDRDARIATYQFQGWMETARS